MVNNKRVLHLDMDAFFAAVEQRDLPLLRGKPVIVGAEKGTRGVVSTCSYEARKYGIHSAMPIAEAARRCPHGVFMRPNGRKYVHASLQLMRILEKYSPVIEPVSIDEAYMDVTGAGEKFGGEEKLAKMIKRDISNKLNITGTIGIASTRIFAKLASDLEKPDGLTIIEDKEIPEKVYPLPVGKLWGIGEKSSEVLKQMSILTIGELAECPEDILKGRFGINGPGLAKAARGEGSGDVLTIEEREDEKSVGHERTFKMDMENENYLTEIILGLAQKTGRRLRRGGFGGRTLTLKIRYTDFETHTHRETFKRLLTNDLEIYESAKYLLLKAKNNNKTVRLLGISVSGLVKVKNSLNQWEEQLNFFSEKKDNTGLYSTVDKLKDKWGENVISFGGTKTSELRFTKSFGRV